MNNKPIPDVKIENLLAKLEDVFDLDDDNMQKEDERYLLQREGDPVMYSGDIAVQMVGVEHDDEEQYIMIIGTIDNERHARRLVAAANAIPQLLDYIKQLEGRLGI